MLTPLPTVHVADDGLGRHGLAAARVGGQQIADALDLDVRFAHGRRAFGANGVLRTDFTRMENALDGPRHLRRADLAQPQGSCRVSVLGNSVRSAIPGWAGC